MLATFLWGGEPSSTAPPPAKGTENGPGKSRENVLEAISEYEPEADAPRQYVIDLEKRLGLAYFVGHVDWQYAYQGKAVRLQADRLMAQVRAPEGSPKEKESKRKDRSKDAEPKRSPESPSATAMDFKEWRDVTIFAEGNVRVELLGTQTYFEADSFYYEHLTGRAVARNVRLQTTFRNASGVATVFSAKSFSPSPVPPEGKRDAMQNTPLVVRAQVLRMEGFESFGGEGIEVSTCDFAVPHFALAATSVEVTPIEPEPAAPTRKASTAPGKGTGQGAVKSGGEDREVLRHEDFMIDPESAWLEVSGHRAVPLPVTRWDTRWQTHLPVRSVDLGHSSQFGYFGGLDWNLNYFLNILPLERFVPISLIDERARVGFETAYMTERGFGWGPNAEYGMKASRWKPWQLELSEWNYHGDAQIFSIRDHGDEDRSTGEPVPREDRYWGHIWHRQSIPYVGLVDLEYSKISDRAFLQEYFETIAKEEKEQETLAYLRRNFYDNFAATGLYQVRVNDFQTQTERLPEGKLYMLQQPVFDTGLYSDLYLQGAYLHWLADNDLGLDPRGYARFDVLNEWAYPVGLSRYLQTRPFALVRYSAYGEGLDPDSGAVDRATFGAGITVSQQWSGIFHFGPDSFASKFLGIPTLKHIMVPKVTYLNVFSNDLDPEDLFQIDTTDTVDVEESISISLRNELFTRKPTGAKPVEMKPVLSQRDVTLETVPYESRCLLDSLVSFVLFPRPLRDNDGDVSSLLLFDNTVSVVPRLPIRAWLELDPNEDFHMERADLSATYEAIPRRLGLTLGDRYTTDRTNFVYAGANWKASDKWIFDAYYAHDFETGRDVDYNFRVSRVFHRFVLSLDLSVDVGEDRNQTVHISFSPIELLKPMRHGGLRQYDY